MLDGLGDRDRAELSTHLCDVRHVRSQPIALTGRHAVQLLDQPLVLPGKHSEASIGRTERDQLVGAARRAELELTVQRQHLEPPPEVALALDQLAEALAPVSHQHPASFGIHGDELRHEIGACASQQPDDARLIRQRGSVALNHRSPPAVGTRRTVDQGRTCGCSIPPIGRRSRASRRSRIHRCTSASHRGSVQSTTPETVIHHREVEPGPIGSLHYKRTGSPAEVTELLGDSKRVAADHHVYALTDHREVDTSAIPSLQFSYGVGSEGSEWWSRPRKQTVCRASTWSLSVGVI